MKMMRDNVSLFLSFFHLQHFSRDAINTHNYCVISLVAQFYVDRFILSNRCLFA